MALKFDKPYLSCQIIDTGARYMPVQYAYGIKKGSPFFQLFHYHITKLQEMGTFNRYARSYGGSFQICPDYSGMPISSKQCFTAFIIMISGVSAGMVCLG